MVSCLTLSVKHLPGGVGDITVSATGAHSQSRTRLPRRLLIREGFASQLLLSHDTARKIQLTRYGGYGYGHLLRNIAPGSNWPGIGPEVVDGLLR